MDVLLFCSICLRNAPVCLLCPLRNCSGSAAAPDRSCRLPQLQTPRQEVRTEAHSAAFPDLLGLILTVMAFPSYPGEKRRPMPADPNHRRGALSRHTPYKDLTPLATFPNWTRARPRTWRRSIPAFLPSTSSSATITRTCRVRRGRAASSPMTFTRAPKLRVGVGVGGVGAAGWKMKSTDNADATHLI